jgi:predicted DNA-binding transcriptional regulator YafY
VRPLERVLHQGYWYLHAWCCDRRERRLFRLDRAVDFEITDRTFVPRATDDAARFSAPSLYAPGASARICLLRIAPGPWATEETGRRLGAEASRPTADGGMELELRADGAAYPVAAVLTLAGAAELLTPPDLRERVAAIAKQMRGRHT